MKAVSGSRAGFTLAELLLALVILGVIATFTIPKVLTSQQDSKFRAVAKEDAAMIVGAFEAYRLANGGIYTTTKSSDLTPYMNYVRIATTGSIDDEPTNTNYLCTWGTCMYLANGSAVFYYPTAAFGGANSTNALPFWVDPDGVYSGGSTGSGKSIMFYMSYNGRLRDRNSTDESIFYSTAGNYWPGFPNLVPAWFSWN